MPNCKYCGLPAKWYTNRHKECALAHDQAKVAVAQTAQFAVMNHRDLKEVNRELTSHTQSGYLAPKDVEQSILKGLVSAVEHFLNDNYLSKEEEASLQTYMNGLPISEAFLQASGLIEQVVKASLIRSFSEGEVPEPKFELGGDLPFLFQKSEKLVWVFHNVTYLEQRTRTEYQGGSQGVSIRLTKRVYYRTGSFKGERVEVKELKNMGQGTVALTTKHFYFGNEETSFKIPYRKIVALKTYSDGIRIQKEGVRSKPQIFKGLDGWFASNAISHLNS